MRLNWSETRSMESWEGVTVGGSPSRVVKLELGGKTLKGRIPAALNKLTGLQTLDLSNNELMGSIPVGLRQLANLQVLDFSHNRLTGSTPTDLGSLAHLRTLALAHNRLTGTIPPQLGNLSRLSVLYLAGNQCAGCIPNALTRVAAHDLSDIALPLCDPVTPRAKSTSTPNATATPHCICWQIFHLPAVGAAVKQWAMGPGRAFNGWGLTAMTAHEPIHPL